MQKKLITLGCIALCVCASSCSKIERTAQEVKPIAVEIQVVGQGEYTPSSHYVGTVEAIREVPLSMQSAGRVTEVRAKEGNRVQRGQVLLRIDSTQAVNALHSAEAAYRQAQDGYERAQQVYDKGAVTEQKMVEIESQLTQTRSLYELAKQRVRECTLLSPCDGVLSGMHVEVGQTLAPGMRIAYVLDLSGYSICFAVPENEIGTVAVGQRGEMECSALDRRFTVEVSEKNMKANPLAHTYEVKARVLGQTGGLMPGMIANVALEHNATADASIIIPARCVLLQPNGATVWLAKEGRAQRREITVGGYKAEGVEVTEGLTVGDTLIVSGYQKLYKDCRILIE